MSSRPEAAGDDALRLAMLAILGALAAFAIARGFEQEARDAGAFAAWMHIRPCGALAQWIEQLRNMPFAGSWLFVPCETADAFLSKNGFRGLTFESWNSVQKIAGRIASVAYAIPMALLGVSVALASPRSRLSRSPHAGQLNWRAVPNHANLPHLPSGGRVRRGPFRSRRCRAHSDGQRDIESRSPEQRGALVECSARTCSAQSVGQRSSTGGLDSLPGIGI